MPRRPHSARGLPPALVACLSAPRRPDRFGVVLWRRGASELVRSPSGVLRPWASPVGLASLCLGVGGLGGPAPVRPLRDVLRDSPAGRLAAAGRGRRWLASMAGG
jgi:hypothetical protein